MNKTITLFLLTICAFTACRHNSASYLDLIENDWKKDNLKGRVKKIENRYYGQNGLDRQLVLEYNEKGFKVREIDSFLVSGEKKLDFINYQYDTINNVTLITRFVNGAQEQQWQNKYDKTGNKIEAVNEATRTIYTYDKRNRMLEEMTYNLRDTSLKVKTVYEYLANGGKRSTYVDPSGLVRIETYEDDTMQMQKTCDQGGDLRKIRLHKKDTAGHIIYAEEKGPDNKLIAYSRNYYNQYNDHVMAISFMVKENWSDTLTMEYVYDNLGNFISVGSSWKREIIYW
jgi:hypothetical protein